jgi:hypothetical protein
LIPVSLEVFEPTKYNVFFGGWDYTAEDLNSRQPGFLGYEKGVPMGGDLHARDAKGAPTFMGYALRDPISAPELGAVSRWYCSLT